MTLTDELIQYCKDCIADTRHVCQKHRWACERFLNDLKKSGTQDFPYIFDEEKALRFFEWAALHKHTKGVLAGESIEFTPIQRFIFGNVYGWIHQETGLRRFRKAYWQVARKNAKSQSLAIVGDYELMALGEPMSEVYIGATKSMQAKIIYNEVVAMLKRCPLLKGKWHESYGVIRHPKSDSILRALSKDDGKTGDGLNPQCGLIDEYHAHPTDEILEVINTGMVARRQPLLFIITTAGTNFGGPCYRVEYPLVEKILDPSLDFDVADYFCMVNELDRDQEGNLIDDVKDEECWVKANPIAATYPEGLANIRSKLASALESPEKMESFLTKNMNLWVNQSAMSYMDMAKWKERGAITEIPVDLYGRSAYVGIDLSKRIDLTAAGIIVPIDVDSAVQYVVRAHGFIPEDTVAVHEKTDKVPYRAWAKAGYLTITPGDVVDYRFIESWIHETTDDLGVNVKELCYDPYNATHFAQDFDAQGITTVEVRQGMRTLSEPTKEAYRGNILHEPNPLLDWAVSNAVTKRDHNENIILDKEKSTNRIDPIAAVINAFSRARVTAEEDMSDYVLSDDFSL
mgnify:CR=1 FL=1